MSPIIMTVLQIILSIFIFLLIPCAIRVAIGPTPSDRLQAIDTTVTILIGVIILLTLLQGSALIFDIGLALAAFSFISTVVIARYLAEGRVF